MREELGLEQPERAIGLSAHDFAILAAGPEVLLTRAPRPRARPPCLALAAAAAATDDRAGSSTTARRLCRAVRASAHGFRRRSRRPARARRQAAVDARPRRLSSPRSRPGCATLTRSMPGMCWGCGRSSALDAADRAAGARHRPASRGAGTRAPPFPRGCRTTRRAHCWRSPTALFARGPIPRRRGRCGGRASSTRRTGSSPMERGRPPISPRPCRDKRRAVFSGARRRFDLARAGRPHRRARAAARRSSTTRAASRRAQAGEGIAGAATAAGRGDPGGGRIRRRPAPCRRTDLSPLAGGGEAAEVPSIPDAAALVAKRGGSSPSPHRALRRPATPY